VAICLGREAGSSSRQLGLRRYSVRMHLEDDKLEALLRWGQGLRDAGGEERAAAGRAILMLIEEIERLRLELSRTRNQSTREDLATGQVDGDTDEPLASTLRGRLPRAATRDSEPTRSGAGGGSATTSPETWIESLRRQE
jgi:hypothetical protein